MTAPVLTLATLDDTERFGHALGAVLRPGDLVLLSGALGAGKTTLTKSIAAGMGVTGTVTSPTFVLARVHRRADGSPGPALVHVDAYRLAGSVELDDLDLDTDLTAAAVVVEWGEGVGEGLADDRLLVRLDRLPDDTRTAELHATGPSWGSRVDALTAGWG
ncbi:tRNA (adenosine(37)-N6)-threonylcarbamoyltransferase complex ATPase subunit type 1 TsaE [Nakamurella flavida]|uniref:tRNA threonylcarbamoyladenosine biosynthesis protein TsaE n=1 Tax=Nakamurella flavida TaxID=363630 RepID=A0A938YT78_9ACTN|nr:tRNA (adenosine(37)-N6)-threonylcarbamoyltransferase complex ATPase subunit type 1 TsaE [Nakamurella flavida]MBM9475905.1 tRNA (adenosine(37)-N6)-threonylcarbamoyltransferase complex ATPase subunit type 1 TsaE [Nakamurella flavida]MBM9478435.1 tRNA (adenosine(37)-N6)-threonylcarbamoyltransferase complex ATPase subunit type 1 TsaE [Nakamurella flavida]MDP9777809.1 tRNA threonylcarbamoyladenosine biosynthesis protein TsaE [Nakamurella flavida]